MIRLNIVVLTINRYSQLVRLLTSIAKELSLQGLRIHLFLSDNCSDEAIGPSDISLIFRASSNIKVYFRSLADRVPFHVHYLDSILCSSQIKSDFTWCLGDDDWLCLGSGRRLLDHLLKHKNDRSMLLFLERLMFKASTQEGESDPIPSVHTRSYARFLRSFNCGKIGVLSQVVFSSSLLCRLAPREYVNHLFFAYPQLCIYSHACSFHSFQNPFINYTLTASLFGNKDYWVHCYECPAFFRGIGAGFIVRIRSFDWLRSICWRTIILVFGFRRPKVKALIRSVISPMDLLAIIAFIPLALTFLVIDYLLGFAGARSKVRALFEAMDEVERRIALGQTTSDERRLVNFSRI